MTEVYTPRSFISGRVKARPRQELHAAAAAAASLFGTESVAIIHSTSQGHVWYLAAPATDLASHLGAASVLSSALPGAKNHKGDAAYVCVLAGGLHAIVVKHGDNLHSFVGTSEMVKRFSKLEGATVTQVCSGEGMVWQLPAEPSKRRDIRLKIAILVSGLITAILASVTWLWAARDVTSKTDFRDELLQEHAKVWAAAVGSIEFSSYPKALADLQKAIAQARSEKGVLQKFEHQNGRSTWTLNVNNRLVTGESN